MLLPRTPSRLLPLFACSVLQVAGQIACNRMGTIAFYNGHMVVLCTVTQKCNPWHLRYARYPSSTQPSNIVTSPSQHLHLSLNRVFPLLYAQMRNTGAANSICWHHWLRYFLAETNIRECFLLTDTSMFHGRACNTLNYAQQTAQVVIKPGNAATGPTVNPTATCTCHFWEASTLS